MSGSVIASNQGSAYAALAARARSTPDALLVTLESLGFAGAISVFLWFPDRIALALPCLALAMLGLWGVAEHVRNGRRAGLRHPAVAALAALQTAAVLIGTIAVLGALYAVVGRAIGTIIS